MTSSFSIIVEPGEMPQDISPLVCIRCDGSHEIGFGHVVRCLALADELRIVHECRVTFLMHSCLEGIDMVRARGYSVLTPSQETHAQGSIWPLSLIEEASADAVVFDIRDDFPRQAMDSLREGGTVVVVIDDISDRCLSADLAFFPPVPQVDRIDWSECSGQRFVGWEWLLLRREIRECHKRVQSPGGRLQVLVTMGGSDPHRFTLKAIRACCRVKNDLVVKVVLGPGFSAHQELDELMNEWNEDIHIFSNPQNILELIQQSHLVVGAFGNTAYEAAALQRFGLYLCGTADHVESASRYMQSGFGISLGLGEDVSDEELALAIDTYLHSLFESDSCELGLNEPSIDGLGVTRIAEKIIQEIHERNGIQQAVATT
jgi:spore coat polysaccharide biosynthesis predicted glycosyltransferase SpsG